MTVEAPQSDRRRGAYELQAVSHIAALLRGGAMPVGDIASLRRMDPRHPPPAFYKLEGLVFDGELRSGDTDHASTERRWAAIVSGLAHLGSRHRDAREDQAMALGRVLGEARYAEARFTRLLQADGHRLLDELPMLARYLAAKDLPVDWTGAARLILSAERRDEEQVRRRVARDYYGALARSVDVERD